MALPALIVVSGPAGSGKTQLAHALAAAIGCPAICRDEIKEGMVHAYGADFRAAPGDPLTKRTFPLFFEVLRVLVAGGVTVVAEAAFQHNNWQQGLTPLLPLARLRIVHCTVDDAVARERVAVRRADRTRAAHADAEWLAESAQRPGAFERIRLAAPTISVDTTDGYVPDLAAIVEFASRP
jgi:predicted kinase